MTKTVLDNSFESSSDLFKGFGEWRHFTRCLTKNQKDILFDSLSASQRKKINTSLHCGGWIDVEMRDKINAIIDYIQKEYNINLIESRCKVLKKKSVYLPKPLWDYIIYSLQDFPAQHKIYVIGGIKAVICKDNPEVVLLVRSDSNSEE